MATNGAHLTDGIRRLRERLGKDPRLTARVALGLLLAANLAVAAAAFGPWGGSEERLRAQLAELSRQVRQKRTSVERLRALAERIEKTRADVDRFMAQYFLDRRAAYSSVLGEVYAIAGEAGLRPKEHSFTFEPIEGSGGLAMLTINGSYEGGYGGLLEFVNAIDRSPRFLTIDRLQATPLQSQPALSVTLRLHAFVRAAGETQ